jgi:hypothetical protein
VVDSVSKTGSDRFDHLVSGGQRDAEVTRQLDDVSGQDGDAVLGQQCTKRTAVGHGRLGSRWKVVSGLCSGSIAWAGSG